MQEMTSIRISIETKDRIKKSPAALFWMTHEEVLNKLLEEKEKVVVGTTAGMSQSCNAATQEQD